MIEINRICKKSQVLSLINKIRIVIRKYLALELSSLDDIRIDYNTHYDRVRFMMKVVGNGHVCLDSLSGKPRAIPWYQDGSDWLAQVLFTPNIKMRLDSMSIQHVLPTPANKLNCIPSDSKWSFWEIAHKCKISMTQQN